MRRYVLFHEAADDVLGRAPAHFAGRRARIDEFAAGDPFVREGAVARRHVREWDDLLA